MYLIKTALSCASSGFIYSRVRKSISLILSGEGAGDLRTRRFPILDAESLRAGDRAAGAFVISLKTPPAPDCSTSVSARFLRIERSLTCCSGVTCSLTCFSASGLGSGCAIPTGLDKDSSVSETSIIMDEAFSLARNSSAPGEVTGTGAIAAAAGVVVMLSKVTGAIAGVVMLLSVAASEWHLISQKLSPTAAQPAFCSGEPSGSTLV